MARDEGRPLVARDGRAAGRVHAAGFGPWAGADIGRGALWSSLFVLILCATRRPVMHLSHATPVPLRHRMPRGHGRFSKPPCSRCAARHPSLAWLPTAEPRRGVRGHHRPLASECLLCLTGTPGPFSARRRTIFCMSPANGPRQSRPKAHGPPRRVTPTRCIRRRNEGNVA